MKKLFFILLIMLFAFSAFAQNTGDLLNHYISVKNGLVSNDSKAALQAASTLHQAVKKEGNFAQRNELLKAIEKLHKAGSIEKQRAAFDGVSAIMWKLVKGSDKVGQAVYYQYCPMKKAYWLSKEKEIKNPYYGTAMLTCGKIVETKP